jgi:serine/threonine protein phosphatase PrpC
VLESNKTPKRVVHDLIELALLGGGGDNVTVLVIETSLTHEIQCRT